jgi:hypothetical protein
MRSVRPPSLAPHCPHPSVRQYAADVLEHHLPASRSGALSPGELEQAEVLLWAHLEGTEAATQRMSQTRPLGWRKGEPTTWLEGHGDALMTSTT